MSLIFLLAVVVGLPLMSYFSNKQLSVLEAAPANIELARIPLYFQSAFMQMSVALLAWFTAKSEQIPVSLKADWNVYAVGAAALLLVTGGLISWLDLRRKKGSDEAQGRLQYILPTNLKERAAWLLTIAIAACCEEYIYRGVLYHVILADTGANVWIAAFLCAMVFGFGHATQGDKAVLTIIPFAMVFQLIVYLSGGLLLAIVTHFIYNAGIDLLFSKKIRTPFKGNENKLE
ncbi:MAG: CPBP family intramembrane metalloprotease [Bacteroidetes bacterium]|nr:CPBP family intramembrane metalloprotease [Bacteroidota bacterium]